MNVLKDDALHLFARCVISGDKVEFYSYSNPIRSGFERKFDIVRHDTTDKRVDNVYRARQNARRLIWSNMTPYTKFVTLTYREVVLDSVRVRRDVKTFVQNLRRTGYDVPYFYVLEHQQERGEREGNEGCLHVHMLIFNDEYLSLDTLNKCWKHGFTDISAVQDKKDPFDQKIADIGAYVCKYITEQGLTLYGKHFYGCSKGLKRPVQERFYIEGLSDTTIGLHPDQVLSCMDISYSLTMQHDFVTKQSCEKDYRSLSVSYFQGHWKEGNIIEEYQEE